MEYGLIIVLVGLVLATGFFGLLSRKPKLTLERAVVAICSSPLQRDRPWNASIRYPYGVRFWNNRTTLTYSRYKIGTGRSVFEEIEMNVRGTRGGGLNLNFENGE